MDVTKAVVVFGGSALAIALAAAVYVAWENSASRNLSLATATLAAASVLFVTQVRFELQRANESDHITFEYTLDHSVPTIRQWAYTTSPSFRFSVETEAAKWFD